MIPLVVSITHNSFVLSSGWSDVTGLNGHHCNLSVIDMPDMSYAFLCLNVSRWMLFISIDTHRFMVSLTWSVHTSIISWVMMVYYPKWRELEVYQLAKIVKNTEILQIKKNGDATFSRMRTPYKWIHCLLAYSHLIMWSSI